MKVGSASDKNRKHAAAAIAAGVSGSNSGSGSQGPGSEASAAQEFSQLLGELEMQRPSVRNQREQDGALFDSLALAAVAPRVTSQDDLLRRDQAQQAAASKDLQSNVAQAEASAEVKSDSNQPDGEQTETEDAAKEELLSQGKQEPVTEMEPSAQAIPTEAVAIAAAATEPTTQASEDLLVSSEQLDLGQHTELQAAAKEQSSETPLELPTPAPEHSAELRALPKDQSAAALQDRLPQQAAPEAPKSQPEISAAQSPVDGASAALEGQNDSLQRIQEALLQKLNAASKPVEPQAPVVAPAAPAPVAAELAANLVRSLVEGASTKAALQRISGDKPQQGPAVDAASAQRPASAARGDDLKARPVRTRAMALQAMEKVESALKEAARSRDGKTISVRLDPPNMGSIKVDVTLRDGVLHARIVPDAPQVVSMLRERAHELQGMLRKLGLSAEVVSVSIGGERMLGFGKGDAFGSQGGQKHAQEQRAPWQGQHSSTLPDAGLGSSASLQNSAKKISDHWIA